MTCPACGSADAYVGLTDIDCTNGNCKYFRADPGSNRTVVAASPITAEIVSTIRKSTSVLITFKALDKSDPTNKVDVEFLWTAPPGVANQRVATLSNSSLYLAPGITADGVTLYRTHWMCLLDGIDPNDPTWKLEANVIP